MWVGLDWLYETILFGCINLCMRPCRRERCGCSSCRWECRGESCCSEGSGLLLFKVEESALEVLIGDAFEIDVDQFGLRSAEDERANVLPSRFPAAKRLMDRNAFLLRVRALDSAKLIGCEVMDCEANLEQ